ncbi:MAG: hypothetical protein KF805_05065 [Phycisphaeraceae bacterium]|nr:hypothetical protein [Phycisphaeraceae bacterium]
MPPNFHSILYDFFIQNHGLNYIAATYETSWYEVAEILDSELARKYMRSANRVLRIRAVGQNLRSRLAAIQTLESTITERRDSSHSSIEARRRAATAILGGTSPRGRGNRPARETARPKPTDLSPAPKPSVREPAKQPAPSTQSTAPNLNSSPALIPSRGTRFKPARSHAKQAQVAHTTNSPTSKRLPAPSRPRTRTAGSRRQVRPAQRTENSS